YNKLMIIPTETKGSNMVTADDTSIMLNKMVQGKISSYDACKKMINIMKKQQIHYVTKKFPEENDKYIGTSPKWSFASKTGNVTGTKHDIGILYVNEKLMNVNVLSSNCDKEIAFKTLSDIGEEIFQYLTYK